MKKSLSITLVVIAVIVLIAITFGAGLLIGRLNNGWANSAPFSMMGRNFGTRSYSIPGNRQNMMGWKGTTGNRYGMMGGYTFGNTANSEPLTIEKATLAVESYLGNLNYTDLEIKEIMLFDNHAYVLVAEKSTGIGAMELLVDPVSLSVFPEYGPNMMWNLKYGHMSGSGMMGGRGMMGGYYTDPGTVSATMTITSEKALQISKQYLDQQYPGYSTSEHAYQFYGYYTIDIMKDGEPTGMLSVNGFSGEVFLHTWHGTFIEEHE